MTPLGAEKSNTCGLHFGAPIVKGECPLCLLAGLKVVTCDPTAVDDVLRAMHAIGATYVRGRSRAVLTFERPEGPVKPGDLIPKKPGARVNGTASTSVNRRTAAR